MVAQPMAVGLDLLYFGRRITRFRAQDETELCAWTTIGTLGEPRQIRLRSLDSSTLSYMRLRNSAHWPVRILWINYLGDEVDFGLLHPGQQTGFYRTYVNHPWIVRDAFTGDRMMVGGARMVLAHDRADEDQEMVVNDVAIITSAPVLKWSMATHRHFPPEFRSIARTLLLVHSRLRSMSASSVGSAAQAVECATPSGTAPASAGGVALRTRSKSLPVSRVMSVSSPEAAALQCGDAPEGATVAAAGAAAGAATAAAATPRQVAKVESFRAWKRTRRAITPNAAHVAAAKAALEARHLMLLSADLVIHVLAFLAPQQRQCVTLGAGGHPDVLPALLPSDPATWLPPPDPGHEPEPAAVNHEEVAANAPAAVVALAGHDHDHEEEEEEEE